MTVASFAEPPKKRRKLNNSSTDRQIDQECTHCIWCEDPPTNHPVTPTTCVCDEILTKLKESKHELIEITNAGTSSTPFECYKLSRNDQTSSFQMDCRESQSIDFEEISRSLNTNGIVILRNLLPPKAVMSARRDILTKYLSEWIVFDEEDPSNALNAECKERPNGDGPSLLSSAMSILSETESVPFILEHPLLFETASNVLGSDHVMTTRYKWLRAVPPDEFTGLHFDSMFMGLGSKQMLSIWIPIGDIDTDHGPLMWCYGSHRCPHWKRYLDGIGYGDPTTLSSDGTKSGWITDDTARHFKDSGNGMKDHLIWCTTDFKAGDVALFGLKLVHQTLRNDTNCYRLSCDTRWQPLCQPLDHRLKSCGVSMSKK